MKKFKKWAAYTIIAIILIIVVGISYITLALPNVGDAENIKINITPQRIKNGEYLVRHVVSCADCHSPHYVDRFGGPIDSLRLGGGGEVFDQSVGFPGHVVVPDITPAKLKDWTDGELFRTITTGVKKDGTPIFPMMPWPYFSKMDREDVYDIIAYIRSLKPIEADYPKAKLDFPLNILVHAMPQKATLGTRPDKKDTVKYGAYLVQIAACQFCHSQDNKGTIIKGLEFAGGKVFFTQGNTLRTANITPDKQTGIGNWTSKDFIARFRAFNDPSKASKVGPSDFQTVMPWWEYSGMTDGDLSSIYAYLRTVKPVSNKVVRFEVKSNASSAGSN
jgi:hypothetical protein